MQRRVSPVGGASAAKDQNRATMKDWDAELDNSDDEAPEEMTFEDAKTQALESVKAALESTLREKELMKEKRRRRNELFQEQKKRKLLSAEVLEEIASSTQKKKKRDSEAPGNEAPIQKKSRVKAASRNLKGNYSVRTLKAPTLASLQQKAAEDFIQARLYGPGTCRTTSCELLSLCNKTAQKKSAAVDFVKKSWAPALKAKSQKEKKRWLHNHQIAGPHEDR
ncbi:U3 small nucleolar RNA-associated protein NOL7 [Synchiropus picturatus]